MDGHLIHVNCKRKRNEEEDSEEMDVIVFTLSVIIAGLSWLYIDDFIPREPSYDWDHERRCYLNRLFHGSEKECIDQLRVSKQGFANLCKVLREKGKLTRTKNVSIEEAVAMFLHILAHNLKYRVIHLNFYRSKETISRQFNRVLSAVLRITKDYLKLHEHVLNESDAGRWKWFEPRGVDTFECVDINKQPAFDHPLLENHKIQMKPSFSPTWMKDKVSTIGKLSKLEVPGHGCPLGMVPIQRTRVDGQSNAKSLSISHPGNIHPLTAEHPGQHGSY